MLSYESFGMKCVRCEMAACTRTRKKPAVVTLLQNAIVMISKTGVKERVEKP